MDDQKPAETKNGFTFGIPLPEGHFLAKKHPAQILAITLGGSVAIASLLTAFTPAASKIPGTPAADTNQSSVPVITNNITPAP